MLPVGIEPLNRLQLKLYKGDVVEGQILNAHQVIYRITQNPNMSHKWHIFVKTVNRNFQLVQRRLRWFDQASANGASHVAQTNWMLTEGVGNHDQGRPMTTSFRWRMGCVKAFVNSHRTVELWMPPSAIGDTGTTHSGWMPTQVQLS